MATELVKHEPLKLPDPRRPATLPSLPVWLARSTAAVRLEVQMKPGTREFERGEVLVLSAEMIPSPVQREEMRAHMDSLRSYLRQTPAESVEAETAVATVVSKLLTVLAGEKKSELVEGARADVYLEVLDDVPCWAVDAAAKLWFRHDCGTDEKGRPHDYKWAPDPGTLRKIALRQTYEMTGRIGKLQRLLDAREFVDCSRQLEDGRAAMVGLMRAMGTPDAGKLTFEEAVKLGKEPAKAPPTAPINTMAAPPANMPAEEAAE